MSHYSLIRISIKNPDIQLLRQVAESLARELGGEVVTVIRDYYGNQRSDFLVGIRTPKLPRGVGIKVDEKGEVALVGDFWQAEKEAERLQRLLIQGYSASAVALSLRQLGYQVAQQKVGEKVYIKALAW
jgi:hypothetical protein